MSYSEEMNLKGFQSISITVMIYYGAGSLVKFSFFIIETSWKITL